MTHHEKHVLPDLPYAHDALEPYIDKQTMEIHHGKHHQAYVNNLNNAIEGTELAHMSLEEIFRNMSQHTTAVRNNGGGHWNHALFWNIMAPPGETGAPSGQLAGAIASAFGGIDEFKKAFASAAATRFGSGWAWLIVRDNSLAITSTPNQDNPLMTGIVPEAELGTPILGVDVWEHAYYLHYQNRRGDYLEAWWNVVDWDAVSARYAAARA